MQTMRKIPDRINQSENVLVPENRTLIYASLTLLAIPANTIHACQISTVKCIYNDSGVHLTGHRRIDSYFDGSQVVRVKHCERDYQ